jgi:hypothetical protein
MKTNRSIPANLEDWLRSFRSSLENHSFPKEIRTGWIEGGEQLPRVDAPKALSGRAQNDNTKLSFAI